MKKHIYSIFILLICITFVLFNLKKEPTFKAIEVISSDNICVDFNKNNTCDNDEKIIIFGVNAFPEKFGKTTQFLKSKYDINEEYSVVLSILAKDFVKKELLSKPVTVKILDKNTGNNYTLAKVYLNNTDFAQTLLKNGWATTSDTEEYKIYENLPKIKKNISLSKKFNYQLRNKKNGKIHTLTCEYGRKAKDYEIGIFDNEKYKKDYCHICHKNQKENISTNSKNFDYNSENLKVYFLDFTSHLKPNSSCYTPACKILLQNIKESKSSIDFAIYGLGNVPEIEKALKEAKQRGVTIRYVVDEDNKHSNIYERTNILKSFLQNYNTDYNETQNAKFNNSIMHNKFFIFDKSIVWLGTANVSETDLSGFNANNVIYIKSKDFANIYEKEFETMYKGSFHNQKSSYPKQEITLGNTEIRAYFSPQDKIITTYLIPYIEKAKKYIYIETFIFTHNTLCEKIIEAHKRGVEVKVIVDATSASKNYSAVKKLRENGIKVKVENYAGKMHMKTIIIDDEYFISGSMNLTKSAENYNDENVLFIRNSAIAKNGKEFFNYIWSRISDTYLTHYVSAESKFSKGSCSDGIDNDYNGLIDKLDPKCK